MMVSRLFRPKLAPDGVKSRQGLWNPRKSYPQNPIFHTPGPGRAKNEGFQTLENFVILAILGGGWVDISILYTCMWVLVL